MVWTASARYNLSPYFYMYFHPPPPVPPKPNSRTPGKLLGKKRDGYAKKHGSMTC